MSLYRLIGDAEFVSYPIKGCGAGSSRHLAITIYSTEDRRPINPLFFRDAIEERGEVL